MTVVGEGETLAGVAMRCEVSVIELCRWNQLRRDEGLRAGQTLRLSPLSQSERAAIPKTNWIDTGMSVGTSHRRSGGGKYNGHSGFGSAATGNVARTGVVATAAAGSGACGVS